MFNKLFPTYDSIYKLSKNIKILDKTSYIYWECSNLSELIVKTHHTLPKDNFGIHWFNGSNIAKKYVINGDLKKYTPQPVGCYLDKFIKRYQLYDKNLAIFSESSYPGGGGEEFLLDIAIYFNYKNYNVYWISTHDWGKSVNKIDSTKDKEYYTEIKTTRAIDSIDNYNYYLNIFKKYNITHTIHQGRGHKLICDIGNTLNICTITFWCFWEEALNIDWSQGLINISKNLNLHKQHEDFLYIINNIDYFYFASKFVKNIVNEKYKLKLEDDHIFPTLPTITPRCKKDQSINSYNSMYITLLDAHYLKGRCIIF